MTERELEGRVAIVTGGGSGQGRAVALALAEKGAHIVFGSFLASHGERPPREETTYPSDDDMAAVTAEIKAHGVRAIGRHHDLASNDSCAALVDTAVQEFGRVDILAGVAGISFQHPLAGHDDAEWLKVIDVNLNGNYRMIRRCLPLMCDRGWGRIVLVASTAANIGAANHAAYCASKAGLLGLMRCAALEGAPHGVTCNAVNPGFVDTGMARINLDAIADDQGISLEQAYADAAAWSPAKRLLQPDEIAAMVAFLCTDAAGAVNMEDITVAAGSVW